MVTGEMFEPVTGQLATRHRVIAPDLRGHGRSRGLPPPYTAAQLAYQTDHRVWPDSVAGFSRLTTAGSKVRSIRVLAPGTDASVVENTTLSAACQMSANSRAEADWPGTVSAACQWRIVSYIRRP